MLTNTQGTSIPATDGMTLSTRTITECNAQGEPIRTGPAVVLQPGIMVESSGDFEPGDFLARVIDCGQHAAVIRFESGREVVAPSKDLHAAVAPPEPNAEKTGGPSDAIAYPDLQGENDILNQKVGECDRRFGIPVPIGAMVQAGDFGVCRVIGGNEEIAILLDSNGVQHAERQGVLHVQTSGPAFKPNTYALVQASSEPADDSISRMRHDPFREIGVLLRNTQIKLGQLDTEFEALTSDQAQAVQLLGEVISKIGEIADNREDRIASEAMSGQGGAE